MTASLKFGSTSLSLPCRWVFRTCSGCTTIIRGAQFYSSLASMMVPVNARETVWKRQLPSAGVITGLPLKPSRCICFYTMQSIGRCWTLSSICGISFVIFSKNRMDLWSGYASQISDVFSSSLETYQERKLECIAWKKIRKTYHDKVFFLILLSSD